MASSFKSTETQLIAIYKLEFYKNKKNWKLYENVTKKLPPTSNTTNNLNKTYNVDEVLPELEQEEQVSQHNKAFLHEEPEDVPDPQTPDPQLPDSAPLESALPDSSAPLVLPGSDHSLYRPHSWSGHLWDGDKAEALWQNDQQEWCGAKAEGQPEELAYDLCDGPCRQQNLWTPASQFELKPAQDTLDPQPQYVTPSQIRQTAEEWLQSQGYPVQQQEEYAPTYDENDLADDSANFVRGAHQAPHSSEIDLSITQECSCACGSPPCALSVRQLARAVRAHHAALALLLREQALRERLNLPAFLAGFHETGSSVELCGVH